MPAGSAPACPTRCWPIYAASSSPLARPRMPLSSPPPRNTRFGSPLMLSRVHWVEQKLVAEITYLSWTGDGLLSTRFSSGFDPTSRQSRCGGNRSIRGRVQGRALPRTGAGAARATPPREAPADAGRRTASDNGRNVRDLSAVRLIALVLQAQQHGQHGQHPFELAVEVDLVTS
jgi:hypothetical protein